jgi:hypothetical protein
LFTYVCARMRTAGSSRGAKDVLRDAATPTTAETIERSKMHPGACRGGDLRRPAKEAY